MPMNNYIPYEKLSKKEKKKLNAERRKDWNGVNPITRIVPDKKAYRRNHKHKSNMFDM